MIQTTAPTGRWNTDRRLPLLLYSGIFCKFRYAAWRGGARTGSDQACADFAAKPYKQKTEAGASVFGAGVDDDAGRLSGQIKGDVFRGMVAAISVG
jgi:hypothetical protein